MELEAVPSEHDGMHCCIQAGTDRALSWANRRGYDGRTSSDLTKIARIAERIRIDPAELLGLEKLDRGAFGAIMKATYNGHPIAVKTMIQNDQDGKNGYSQDIRNLLLELAIVCRLSHPHVVDFYGMSTYFPESAADDGNFHLGFVFELCSGGSLFSNLHEAQTHYSFSTKMRMLREVAVGMVYLHNEKIVHRDLSSRNILLTQDGTVKIADFGCARRLVGDSYDSSTISGSPTYMPPEQLCGELLTLKVDVWALGTVIWELVCENIPWRGQGFNSVQGLREKIVKKGERLPHPAESSLPPGAHGPLVKLLHDSFQKQPQKRPSMCQVETALITIEEIIAPEGWTPNCRLAVQEKSLQPDCLMSENPDTIQKPMGPLQLEHRLRAYYRIYNPAKVKDVKLVASNFRNKQVELNDQLRSRYSCDLWDMDELPKMSTPTPKKRTSRAESQAAPKTPSCLPAANEAKHQIPYEMGFEELEHKLELYYQIYNPIKALNAKQIATKFLKQQGKLNMELQQRYNTDLFGLLEAKPLDGPNAPAQPERPADDAQPADTAGDEHDAGQEEESHDEEPVPCEGVQEDASEAVGDAMAGAEVDGSEPGDGEAEPAGAVESGEVSAEPKRGSAEPGEAILQHADDGTDAEPAGEECPAEQAQSKLRRGSDAGVRPPAPMRLKEVAARLRAVYAHVNPTKQHMAEAVVRKYKSVAALNRELHAKYGVDLASSPHDLQLAAGQQTQRRAQTKAEETERADQSEHVQVEVGAVNPEGVQREDEPAQSHRSGPEGAVTSVGGDIVGGEAGDVSILEEAEDSTPAEAAKAATPETTPGDEGAATERCAESGMGEEQLARRLRVFYEQYNPAKLALVPEIFRKFVGKQEQLNATLRARYGCDLWALPEDAALRGPEERSRQSSVCSTSDGEAEGRRGRGRAGPSKTCSEADTEQWSGELASDEEPAATSRGGSRSPALEPTAEGAREGTVLALASAQDRPGDGAAAERAAATVLRRLEALYERVNPAKVGLVAALLAKYQGDVAALNAVLQSKYGVDLDTPVQTLDDKFGPAPEKTLSASSTRGRAVKDVARK